MRKGIEKEQNSNETKGAWQKLVNLVVQLRKCCSCLYLLLGVAPDPYCVGEHANRASGKFILLEELIKNLIFEQDKKIRISSRFMYTLD